MDEGQKWLLAWFEEKGVVDGHIFAGKMNVNYFDAGLIDSFGVIELIQDIEGHFNIRFDEGHFQDRRFSFIGGLWELIEELKNT
jgi:acyl carrier protein